MKDTATTIIELYNEWRGDRDEEWAYDQIHEFFEGVLSRGSLTKIIELLKSEASL